MIRSRLLAALALAITATPALADVHVYGPGGPLPAMKAAAADFERQSGIKIVIDAGPTDRWIGKARRDADLIFSGSDTMMTGFVRKLGGHIAQRDIAPLYDRPAAILVRKGNPKHITGFRDLQRPGL
jgi:accessory colonization factor AcfC